MHAGDRSAAGTQRNGPAVSVGSYADVPGRRSLGAGACRAGAPPGTADGVCRYAAGRSCHPGLPGRRYGLWAYPVKPVLLRFAAPQRGHPRRSRAADVCADHGPLCAGHGGDLLRRAGDPRSSRGNAAFDRAGPPNGGAPLHPGKPAASEAAHPERAGRKAVGDLRRGAGRARGSGGQSAGCRPRL